MENGKDKGASFIRGVEDRLNNLFGEEAGKDDKKDVQQQATAKESLRMREMSGEAAPQTLQREPADGKLSFIGGIEEKLGIIFGSETNDAVSNRKPWDRPPRNTMIIETNHDIDEAQNQTGKESDARPSILDSGPIDLRRIVLAIELDANEKILEDFDNEIENLHNDFASDPIILGFLRILRFLGKYIRINLTESHEDAIALLSSICEDMEDILLSAFITEERKQAVLHKNISRYKAWVEKIDLEARLGLVVETSVIQPLPDSINAGSENDISPDDLMTQPKPAAPIEETPISFTEMMTPVPEKPSPLLQLESEGKEQPAVTEPIALSRPDEPMEKEITGMKPPEMEEVPTVIVTNNETIQPVMPDNVAETLSAIKDLTPHEAFAYALEDIKKTISAEFSAIRTELRLWRAGR
ncbi:MAG: hypothetical protein CSYNP_02614 [Syntrophus sp. SKADARSKE-3]|nr:hypothetical protein [Syntrophus sp. SKADARSKE-3]